MIFHIIWPMKSHTQPYVTALDGILKHRTTLMLIYKLKCPICQEAVAFSSCQCTDKISIVFFPESEFLAVDNKIKYFLLFFYIFPLRFTILQCQLSHKDRELQEQGVWGQFSAFIWDSSWWKARSLANVRHLSTSFTHCDYLCNLVGVFALLFSWHWAPEIDQVSLNSILLFKSILGIQLKYSCIRCHNFIFTKKKKSITCLP